MTGLDRSLLFLSVFRRRQDGGLFHPSPYVGYPFFMIPDLGNFCSPYLSNGALASNARTVSVFPRLPLHICAERKPRVSNSATTRGSSLLRESLTGEEAERTCACCSTSLCRTVRTGLSRGAQLPAPPWTGGPGARRTSGYSVACGGVALMA